MATERLTNRGTTIGYLEDSSSSDGQRVLDRNHKTVGWIREGATLDARRVRVADYPDAGLLLRGG